MKVNFKFEFIYLFIYLFNLIYKNSKLIGTKAYKIDNSKVITQKE